jgi:hypothetical protein
MHDPASCRLCEDVPPAAPRRHWKHAPKARAWRVIADGPDLMEGVPRMAHFITVLAYRPGPDDARHYHGPLTTMDPSISSLTVRLPPTR